MIGLTIISAIVIRIVSILIMLFLVIPRMYAEIQKTDDIRFLRVSLFILGILLTFIPLGSLFINFCVLADSCNQIQYIDDTAFFNSTNQLIIAIVLFLIYHRRID